MNKKLLTILLSVLLPVFLVSAVVYATTSIGDDITIEDALTVTGLTTLNDDVTLASGKDLTLQGTGVLGFTGTLATGISFSSATFVPDANRTDIALEVGSRASELSVTMAASASQNFDPVQFNVNIAGANPTSVSTVNLIYSNITHDTTDMSYLRLKNADWNIAVSKNLQDAYVYQGEIVYGGTGVTVGGESAVMSLNMNAGTNAVTGSLRGLIINMYGAGLTNAASIGLEVRSDGGSATVDEGIRIWSVGGNAITNGINFTGTITHAFDFNSIDGSNGAKVTDAIGAGANAFQALVKIDINGTPYYIPAWNAGGVDDEW